MALSPENKPLTQAVVQHIHKLRVDLLHLFILALISFSLLSWTVYEQSNIHQNKSKQSYVATSEDNKNLVITPVEKPLSVENDAKLDAWVKESLVDCLTMDFSNVNQRISYCNNNIFSSYQERIEAMGWSLLGKASAGELFYRALKESFLLSMVFDTRSTMTIELTEFNRVSQGVYQRVIKYTDLKKKDGVVKQTKGRKTYRYVYHATYKFKIIGKKVDIPMEYEIIVDRVSETSRSFPVGIRSIRTNE